MENKIENPVTGNVESRVNQIKELANKLFKGEQGPEMYSELAVFVGKLREKGYKVEEYAFYHAASGCNPDKPWSEFPEDRIDFPGDDSVLEFLKQHEIG